MAVAPRELTEELIDAAPLQTGGEIMCEALVREGVRVLLGYPGGAIMPF